MRIRWIAILPIFLILSACSGTVDLPGQVQLTPVPTDCGCSAEGPGKLTLEPSGELDSPAGPGLSGGGGEGDTESLEEFRDRWTTFTSDEVPFTFDYPAAYDSPAYKFCTARIDDFPPEGADFALNLGSRTTITAAPVDVGTTLAAAADLFRTDARFEGVTFDPPQERTVAGLPALALPYRSDGTGRYAEAVIFLRDGVLYTVESGSPSACDIPELNLTEMNAFSQLLESFEFK